MYAIRSYYECGERDHRRLDRVDGARDNGLQRLGQSAADNDRIDGLVGQGRMSAATGDLDDELVRGGRNRPGTGVKVADRKS